MGCQDKCVLDELVAETKKKLYIYICTQDEKRILQALQVSKKIRPFQLIYPPPKKTIKTYNMLHMAQKFELHQKINDICPLVQS